jgi:hypothetical protein
MKFSTAALIASTALAATIGLASAQISPPAGTFPAAGGATTVDGAVGALPGDHYLCYIVDKKIAPLSVALKDQFGTYQARVIAITRLCNPVQKMYQGKTTEVRNPRLHYVCYRVETQQTTRMVMVKNQFGTDRFPVKGPTELCLPSLKQIVPTNPTGGTTNPTGAPQ